MKDKPHDFYWNGSEEHCRVCGLGRSNVIHTTYMGSATEPSSASSAPRAAAEESAVRTVASIAAMLGWMNVPPRETLEADIRALKARAQTRPPFLGTWQPIETHDGGDLKAFFWIEPLPVDECPTDTSGKPITAGGVEPFFYHGRYGNWGALFHATHWQPEPDPPCAAAISVAICPQAAVE